MNRFVVTVLIWMTGHLALGQAAQLEPALKAFADYEYGQPKKVLHDTRMTAFRGTKDEQLRLQHERLLLAFVQSEATVAARREACMWLSDLGTKAARPVLEKLAADKNFADVAQIALDALDDSKPVSQAVPSHNLAQFKAEVMASGNPADQLTRAVQGPDEARARLAFKLIAEGTATREACAWLGANIQTLNEPRQIMSMNVLIRVNAAEKEPVITSRSREAEGAVRLAAIRNLGTLGRREDLTYLLDLWDGEDPAAAQAARSALRAMPDAVVRKGIIKHLKSPDPKEQAVAIEWATLRGGAYAADELSRIADQDSHPNQKAAIRAMGRAAPPEDFERVLKGYMESEGRAIEKDMQKAAWDLARRQANYDQALNIIDRHKANSSEKMTAALTSMAKTLSGMKPKLSLEEAGEPRGGSSPAQAGPVQIDPRILLPGSCKDIVPKRFEVAAYLNCGPQKKTRENGITIECPGGRAWNSHPGTDPSLSVLFADSSLDFNISGLEPQKDYILGLTWWDSTFNGRRQAIRMNGEEVLPDTTVKVFEERSGKSGHKFQGRPTPSRIQFALLPEHIRDGTCKISVRKTGPSNTVTSEIWVMKRKRPRAEKQVLLVSGQDYPGHHWRKTGPVMEKIIVQDERMEVTICENPGAVALKHLGYYDAVFVHFKNYKEDIPATPAMKDRLMSYVKNGGGMCMSHFACGAFMEWPEFVNISGRIWSGGGHDRRGPFTVKVVDRNHPITKGLGECFETDDELYWCLTGEPRIHELCNAMSKAKKANQTQALVFEPGKGRTFLCTLGHDVKAYDAKEVQQLYRQGTAWSAGLE